MNQPRLVSLKSVHSTQNNLSVCDEALPALKTTRRSPMWSESTGRMMCHRRGGVPSVRKPTRRVNGRHYCRNGINLPPSQSPPQGSVQCASYIYIITVQVPGGTNPLLHIAPNPHPTHYTKFTLFPGKHRILGYLYCTWPGLVNVIHRNNYSQDVHAP